MSNSIDSLSVPGGERVAAWSAGIGLVASLMVAAVSGRLLLDEQGGSATMFGALGFSVAWTAPFVASLGSLFIRNAALRRSVWLASGILALGLAGLTLFSGAWLLFGPAGVGLITAWWLALRGAEWVSPTREIVATGWMLIWLGGALVVLTVRETPACWDAHATGGGWVEASSRNECTSDIVNDLEGVISLVGVMTGLAGVALMANGSNQARHASES